MSVYFIRCDATNTVKIGHSEAPLARLSQIQCGNPAELTLAAVESGGELREAELHRRFAADRVRGEWFRQSDALSQHIEALGPPQLKRESRASIPGTTLSDYEVAEVLGTSRSYPTQLRLGYRPITLANAVAVFAATGDLIGPLADASPEEAGVVARYALKPPHFEARQECERAPRREAA